MLLLKDINEAQLQCVSNKTRDTCAKSTKLRVQ